MQEQEVAPPFWAITENVEIMGVNYLSQEGERTPGYQWRLRVLVPATETEPDRVEMTRWVLSSPSAMEALIDSLQIYLSTRGHLARSAPPDAPVQ